MNSNQANLKNQLNQGSDKGDMSEWKEYFLGDIGFFNNGVNKDKNSFGHGFPFVNLLDIFDKDRIENIPKGLVAVSSDELSRYDLKEGDILFVRSSVKLDGVGKACAVMRDLKNTIYSGFVIRFRQTNPNIEKMFASYYLNSHEIRCQIIAKASQSANTNVNQESLKTIKIKLPSLTEQRKIAHILSTCDAVIEKTQSAIAKYKAIKQGMLQDLFTRGVVSEKVKVKSEKGEWMEKEVWKLRPRYEDAPELYKESKLGWIPMEWDEMSLEDSTDYVDYRGKTPPKSDFGVFLITAKNIRFGYIDYEISKEYIRADLFEIAMSRGKVKLGDVLFTTEAPLGNVAQINREDVALAQRVIKYRAFDNLLDNNYLALCLMSDGFQRQLFSEATGTTVLGIKGSRLHKLKIAIPSLDEQRFIVKRLIAIDTKLQTEQSYLQKMQMVKKGLMEDLLSGKKCLNLDLQDERINQDSKTILQSGNLVNQDADNYPVNPKIK